MADGVTTPENKPRRVAMLSLHSSPLGPLGTRDTGGMSVYVREVARGMASAGHAVDIFTCAPCSNAIATLYPGVRLIALNHTHTKAISKEGLIDHLPEAAHALDQFARCQQQPYDMIHSHYWLSGEVGATVQKQWGSPHLITFHTLGLVKNRTTEGEAEPEERIASERRLVDTVDAIVVPSDGERRHLLNLYGAESDRVHTIPCGVNLEQFKPMDKRQARTRLKIDPDAAVILFVGRFAPVKGMDSLLHAVAELAPRFAPMILMVAGGDGAGAAATIDFRRQSEVLGIESMVRMDGRIDHDALPLYYNAADLLALPSTYESFGLVTLESLACGRPVAATCVGGAAAVIKDGVNGTLIDRPDSDEVARGIERVLTRVRARQYAAQTIRGSVAAYGWNRVAASIISVYDAISGTMPSN